MSLEYCQIAAEPRPHGEAVVRAPQVRFTLLTSRLIRMEYSPTEEFEDHASQPFWYRRQPLPEFTVTEEAGVLVIETPHLLLRYAPSARGFTPVSLSIHVKATDNTWHFGEHIWKSGDLKGTARTLDETNGFVALESGLMARSGWAIVDDSRTLVFDDQSWLVARSHPENLDLYFFGYGHDYIGCLQDFQKVAGPPPLIPRWLLGNWWSRFWAYTQEELQGLMEDFAAHEVPLAVCIVDMDWHIVETGNQSVGWTGYTWNRKLFPDPQGLIDWLHAKGLRTALNLHPADGIFPHEEQYAAAVRGTAYENAKLLADAWCAAFVWKKVKDDNLLPMACVAVVCHDLPPFKVVTTPRSARAPRRTSRTRRWTTRATTAR